MNWRKSAEGERAVRFINNLTHTGDYSGEPFRLRPWQEEYVRRLFGTITTEGRRQYAKSLLMLPRKNGKTELIAAIGLYCFLGTGKTGQEIYSAASDRNQAGRIFKAVAQMIEADKYLSSICTIKYATKEIVCEKNWSVFMALSSDARRKHGLRPSVVLFDELHTQTNRDLYEALDSAFGATKEPLFLMITTAGNRKQSICYEEYQYALKVLDDPSYDPSYLPVIYAIGENDDWTDEKVWANANPALGDFLSIDYLRKQCLTARHLPARENAFRQLYLNQWVEQSVRWLPVALWEQCREEFNENDLAGRDCVLSLDLSAVRDLTALVALFDDGDDTWRCLHHFWVPKGTAEVKEREHRDKVPYSNWQRDGWCKITEGQAVDRREIRRKVNEFGKLFRVGKVVMDGWQATELANWLREDGFEVVSYGQSMGHLSPPSKKLETMILESRIKHNGNPVMTWNVGNVAVVSDGNENIKPVKHKSTDRIDGVVALLMALGYSMGSTGDERSVYEDRGLFVL